MSAGGQIAVWDKQETYRWAVGDFSMSFTIPSGYDRLDQVDLLLSRTNSVSGNIDIYIYACSGDAPTGSALASASMSANSVSTSAHWYSFSFTPITVTPGAKYCIKKVDNTVAYTNMINWWCSNSPGYSLGQGYLNGANYNVDFSFIAYGYLYAPATTTPTVLSDVAAGALNKTTCTMGGNITSTGGETITARGICYSSSTSTPTTADSTAAGTDVQTGVFSASITGLTSGTLYYMRAYATNSNGTSYGGVTQVKTTGTNRVFMYASQAFTTYATGATPISSFSIKMSDGNPYYCSNAGAGEDYIRQWWIVNDNSGVPGSTIIANGLFPSMTCTTGTTVTVSGLSIPIEANTKYHLVMLIDCDDNTTTGTENRAHWDYSLLNLYASHNANHSAEFGESETVDPGNNFSSITWCNPGAATSISNANPCVVTRTAHRFATGDEVSFTTTDTLPTGLSTGTTYYVIYATANTFNLATSYANAIAGTKIATTGAGAGTHTIVIDRDYQISVTQATSTPAYSLYKVSDTDIPTVSAVDSTNGLEAKYLTAGNGRLLFSGSSLFPRRVFYSEAGTDIFLYKKVTGNATIGSYPTVNIDEAILTSDMVGWDVWNSTKSQVATIETITDADTMTISTASGTHAWAHEDVIYLCSNYFDLDGKCTGLVSLGDQNPFLAFTENHAYLFDPNSLNSRLLGNYGCSSHRSIKVLRGSAFWINKDGMYRFGIGMTEPVKISLPIENNVTFKGIWNGINPNNFSEAAAFTYNNKYYVSVGDNSYIISRGLNIEDCLIVYNLDQQSFTVEGYPQSGLGTVFGVFDSTVLGKIVIGGSRDDMSLYKMYTRNKFTDDASDGSSSSYTYYFRTKELESGQIELDKILKELYLKLYSKDGTIISYARDGDNEYNYWTTTSTTPDNKKFHRELVAPFGDANLKSISIQFSGEDAFILYGLEIYLKETNSSNLKPI
jgi:hypothetical protein